MKTTANEIIDIEIGDCGNKIGNTWLNNVLWEHALDLDGVFCGKNIGEWSNGFLEKARLEKINSYFYEKGRGVLSHGYIRQQIQTKYISCWRIPNSIKRLCKQYVGSFTSNEYTARSIFIDSDPSTIDQIKVSPFKNLLNPNNFIAGSASFSFRWYAVLHVTIISMYIKHKINQTTFNIFQGAKVVISAK